MLNYTTPTMENNIEFWYHHATIEQRVDGRNWYRHAHHCAVDYSSLSACLETPLTVMQVAGVIAALSPRNRWEVNLSDAHRLVQKYIGLVGSKYSVDHIRKVLMRDVTVHTTHTNKRKAVECLLLVKEDGTLVNSIREDILGGDKVRSFFDNIVAPNVAGSVTIDVWAYRAATNPLAKSRAIKGRDYEALAEAYRAVARKLGILPHVLQAIVWMSIRDCNGVAVIDQLNDAEVVELLGPDIDD